MRNLFKSTSRSDASKSRSTTIEAPEALPATTSRPYFPGGVEILYDHPEAAIDICFIHGLTGNRRNTWSSRDNSVIWPKDVLPSILGAVRILTFGYDAYIVTKSVASHNGVLDHAKNLLNDLTRTRIGRDVSRPLILVAHSLGGIVSKEAILLSRNNSQAHLRWMFDCVHGVVFMGTPHKGSWMADWAKISANALGLAKSTNSSLLDILKEENKYLESIHDRFCDMLKEQHRSRRAIEVICFFEELPMPYIKRMVVPKKSATIDGYPSFSIHEDHRNMVKFGSNRDPSFQRVLGELQRWQLDIRQSRISHGKSQRDVYTEWAISSFEGFLVCGIIKQHLFHCLSDIYQDISNAKNGCSYFKLNFETYNRPLSLEYKKLVSANDPFCTDQSKIPRSAHDCQRSPPFLPMNSRHNDINKASNGTSSLLLSHPRYTNKAYYNQGLR